MDALKSLSLTKAKLIVACVAFVGLLIWCFVSPISMPFGGGVGVGEMFKGGSHVLFPIIMWVVSLLLSLIFVVTTLMKKKPVGFILPAVVFVCVLVFGIALPKPFGMGTSVILNLIIYALITAFCYLYKPAAK